jgi:hypothetical protein
MASQACEVKRIAMNSARHDRQQADLAFMSAKKDFLACEGPAAVGAAAMTDVSGTITRVMSEGQQIQQMNEFLLRQMQRSLDSQMAIGGLVGIAQQQNDKTAAEIARLQTEIRTARRRFLDADPSVSPAVAGMYFTKVPDNKVLIAFLVCYGAFLLFTSALVIMNQVPIYAFQSMTSGDRVKIVGGLWLIGLLLGYVGFFMFT